MFKHSVSEVGSLATETLVQTHLLGLLAHPDRRDAIDEPQHPEGEGKRPDGSDEDGSALHEEKVGVSMHEAGRPGGIERRRGENAQHESPEYPAYAMDSPDIEGVVPADPIFELYGIEADCAGEDADETRGGWRDEAGGGRDRGQARHAAGEQADELGLLRAHPVYAEPGEGGEGGGEVRVQKRDGRYRVDAELGACVESVPAEPEQPRAQRNHRDAVG